MISNKHLLLWFQQNPIFIFKPIVWKHLYIFRNESRFLCQRKFCSCNDNIVFKYFNILEKKHPLLSNLKPIMRYQKQCKHAFVHFSSCKHIK